MRLTSLLKRRVIWAKGSKESIFDPRSWVWADLVWSLKRELRTHHTSPSFGNWRWLRCYTFSFPALSSLRVPVFVSLGRCGDPRMCDPLMFVLCSSLFPTVCLCVFILSNCVFVCLSLLGIVFLPNAALYWLCEFLSRNRPNSGREFRSLREIMGQSHRIYGAHTCPTQMGMNCINCTNDSYRGNVPFLQE